MGIQENVCVSIAIGTFDITYSYSLRSALFSKGEASYIEVECVHEESRYGTARLNGQPSRAAAFPSTRLQHCL